MLYNRQIICMEGLHMDKVRFINKKKSFSVDNEGALADSISFIEETLSELGISSKNAMRSLLAAEEILTQFEDGGYEITSIIKA